MIEYQQTAPVSEASTIGRSSSRPSSKAIAGCARRAPRAVSVDGSTPSTDETTSREERGDATRATADVGDPSTRT